VNFYDADAAGGPPRRLVGVRRRSENAACVFAFDAKFRPSALPHAMPLLGAHQSLAGGDYKAVEIAHATGCDCVQLFTKTRRVSVRHDELASVLTLISALLALRLAGAAAAVG